MEKSCFFLALALLLLNNSSPPCLAKTFFNSTTDAFALLAFRKTISSDPNNVLSKDWCSNTSICNWTGVSCSIKHHRVTALNLSGFDLGGTVAPHLGNLTFLRYLDISSNNFKGSIPSELSNLRRLKEINISLNSFDGEVPSWLGALPQLERLYLYNNTFSGGIPSSLFNMSKLQTLDMSFNHLGGNIPEKIGNSSSLETVTLEGNMFTGLIPRGILNVSSINIASNSLSGRLPVDMCDDTPKLETLITERNQLEGEIPPNIWRCRQLESLVLSNNHFNGKIPSEIGSLSKLRVLYLRANNFEGRIPKEIGNLTSLTYLVCDTNNLTGELPGELGNLAFLEGFSVRTNFLNGSVPSSMFNISTLTVLELSENHFSGSLPSTMGLRLFNLEMLYLHTNTFNGPIPTSINNASKLTLLDLSNNSFSGSIPDFGNLRLLQILGLSLNNLTAAESPTQELGFLTSLTNSKHLEVLDISINPLGGFLPASIGNLSSSNFQAFWARGCNINGVIPFEIGNLSSLLVIFISQNQLTGLIPRTIGKLKQLQRLSLYENQLQGNIPHDLCQMSNLGELFLSENMLTGPIPECLGELKSLREVTLDSNQLNSTIPSNLWNLGDLVSLSLSSNNLGGYLSSEIGSLHAINQLDLSSNQFSGNIPSSIVGCQSLESLNLSNNKFEGSIPQSLGNIKGLIVLDLSNNSLSGSIPGSLKDLPFLREFNVSYNRLEGRIPNEGSFVDFTAESFVRNFALCGPTRFGVPPCVENHRRSRRNNVVHLMKCIMPPIVSTIILVIVIVMLIKRKRLNQIPSSTDSLAGISWTRVSYRELLLGTCNFSETNLLGRGSFGSVFKGTISDGLNVAVKVFNLELEGASKSFDTECEILSSIRHRNLVRVIGCCSNIEFKAIILAYMPNGSLDRWLYSNNYCLDLTQRLQIAADIALALEYLHHGHTFPVVHCDVKPSNVLLDEDMTAHLSDFGVAKLFDEGEVVIQTKTLATIGYAAPEYGSEGKVSINGDVYSYGIMLLEIFTGKKPTDDMFSGEMNLKQWVSKAILESRASEIVAPSLLSREDQCFYAMEQCVSSILDLAMGCLHVSPEERLNTVQIVAALHKIKAHFSRATNEMLQQ